MPYQPKSFEQLLGVNGLSDTLLKNHFTLYQGYVANTNKVAEILSSMAGEGKAGTPEFAELKRRFGWEFNGMRLHELYFGNMSKGVNKLDTGSALSRKITEDFGSFENWERDFKGTGTMRGIGWVILYLDHAANRLFNVWVNEHDTGHLSGAVPLLVMDVFEHAYMTDYGLKRADYIEVFFRVIDWAAVSKRFNEAKR